ncbi:hypothetical protein M0P48_03660 [Candidatus Gracilibacteria bacterium]|jgi:hypothetical protein|nr:hypothetical protein [Candidatus Gracilibacteria bacterium]
MGDLKLIQGGADDPENKEKPSLVDSKRKGLTDEEERLLLLRAKIVPKRTEMPEFAKSKAGVIKPGEEGLPEIVTLESLTRRAMEQALSRQKKNS